MIEEKIIRWEQWSEHISHLLINEHELKGLISTGIPAIASARIKGYDVV